MAKNEKSSPKIATLASWVLSDAKTPTIADSKKLAASVLTQAPDKKKGGK
jgi:hypothetical protein